MCLGPVPHVCFERRVVWDGASGTTGPGPVYPQSRGRGFGNERGRGYTESEGLYGRENRGNKIGRKFRINFRVEEILRTGLRIGCHRRVES